MSLPPFKKEGALSELPLTPLAIKAANQTAYSKSYQRAIAIYGCELVTREIEEIKPRLRRLAFEHGVTSAAEVYDKISFKFKSSKELLLWRAAVFSMTDETIQYFKSA